MYKMMDYDIDIFYGKEISKEEAENCPIRDIDVKIHKMKLFRNNFEYLYGTKFRVDRNIVEALIKKNDPFACKFANCSSQEIQEISEAEAMSFFAGPPNIDKVGGYKYYVCAYVW